jgi:hypothetical protein
MWSKKIHNFAMWFAIILGVPLSITGIIMEEGDFLIWTVSDGIWNTAIEIHRLCSDKFALVLAVMMITGMAMWAIPKILSRREKSKLS